MGAMVRVQAGPPVLKAPSTLYTTSSQFSESAASTRDRQGNAAFATMAGGALPIRYVEGQRLLTNGELWLAYRQCPDVRSCVDAIVRKVSTWAWAVVPTLEVSDPRYERALQIAAECTRFLQKPNNDLETWQVLVSKFTRDLMVFDALAGEHVEDNRGRLVEIVALRGGDITPQVDQHQRLERYRQDSPAGVAWFEPEQLLYLNLYPNTTTPGGVPLIETLITEVITLMRQSKHLMLAVDADEVPPGILVLAGIAGKAADRAVESLRNMKGQDHKLRVLTSNNPQGLTAEWVELRHTPKDLDLAGVVKEVRRTVWRLFGVKPATQGDTEATPRATAEVQVDAEDSGLILPILEALATAINQRTLPLVVGDPELALLVEFQFDLKTKLSPEAEKQEGERDAADFDRGVITVNERRKNRGLAPFGPEGDIPLVKTGTGYFRLVDVVAEPAPPGEAGAAPSDGKGGGIEDPAASDAKKPAGDKKKKAQYSMTAPVQQVARALPSLRGRVAGDRPAWSLRAVYHCTHEAQNNYEHRAGTLPSDWQAAGKFADHRTISLERLGDQLLRYSREVSPLYRRARLEVVAAVRSYLKDGKISNEELILLSNRITNAMDALELQWSEATEPMYRSAAQVGRDAAVDFTGAQVVAGWAEMASHYHLKAMGYLKGERGLLTDIRSELLGVLLATVRARGFMGNREDDPTAAIDGIDSALLLGAIRKVFDSNEYRIQNWSGKLVELANQVVVTGLQEANTQAVEPAAEEEGAPPPAQPSDEWMYEWVSVEDTGRCDTCIYEGAQGFRSVSKMTTVPGGGTICRGRCRCVLVFWTSAEVKSGTAISLSGTVRSRVIPAKRIAARQQWLQLPDLQQWLREHYSDEGRLSAPRISVLRDCLAQGLYREYLVPPDTMYVFRGLQVRRAALAKLLGSQGIVRSLGNNDVGAIRLKGSAISLRDIANTDGYRDRSWSLSSQVAVDFASANGAIDHFPEDDENKVYGVILVSLGHSGQFILNYQGAAADPEIANYVAKIWGVSIGASIEREQEVITDQEVTPVLLVYTRWDKIAELGALLRAGLAI